ncbi:MAG TPA: rod-binding protein, partial [Caulobacter sp.]|nr:rod-binding protein [Caulobacter sp.]
MSALSSLSTLVPQLNTTTAAVKTAAQAATGAAKAVVASAEDLAKRATIKQTAENFESSFMSVMMQQMFEGVKTSEPFGGGNGEEMFKSILTDAMSKQVTKSGGIGLASSIQREMLKMQGL